MLNTSEEEAATISFQITFFRNQGFCIGVSCNKTVFDAKSLFLFLKSWAYICKHTGKDNSNPDLPPELTPVLDRTVIQDPEGLDMLYLNTRISMASLSGKDTIPKSLKLFRTTADTNFVRGIFKLSDEDIQKIRQEALISSKQEKEVTNEASLKHFSTFVLVYSYVAILIAKAKGIEKNKNWILLFTADGRARLDPPVPDNYFGNCIIPIYMQTKAECFIKEDGLAFVAEELTKVIKGLKGGALSGAKEKIQVLKGIDPTSTQKIGAASSPRLEVYGTNFGWGKPKQVEFISIDRDTSISMAESRDGNGGIEVGVVLKMDEMKTFRSLFCNDFCMLKIVSHL